MSFAWFPFNIKDFLANTMRLNTEAKGAYLCLMLDYYERESAPPDDDDVLSSIAGLTLEAWLKHRKVIAPLFIVAGGLWKQDRIEHEILEGKRKHAAYVARAAIGGRAKAEKRRLVLTTSVLQAELQPTQLQLHKALSLSVDDGSKAESGDKPPEIDELPQSNPLGRAYRELVDNGIVEPDPPALSPIDRNYQPPELIKLACLADADITTLHLEVQKFVLHHHGVGSLAVDWDSIFEKWWLHFLSYRKPKPKPRVEVNSTSAEEGETVNWEWYVKRWLTNQSTWSRRAGPEPGQPGCRVPAAVFEKHGIDPATGLKATETSE